jgi:hypothetical protein
MSVGKPQGKKPFGKQGVSGKAIILVKYIFKSKCEFVNCSR